MVLVSVAMVGSFAFVVVEGHAYMGRFEWLGLCLLIASCPVVLMCLSTKSPARAGMSTGGMVLMVLAFVFHRWIGPRIDFAHEYGNLAKAYHHLASFETKLPELTGYRLAGRVVLCNEDGGYREQRQPNRLRAIHRADVSNILYIRKGYAPGGTYSDGTTGVQVILTVAVVDVGDSKLAGVFHVIGYPDPHIVWHAPGVETGARNGTEDAERSLKDWLEKATPPAGTGLR
jgi:hypothetical protein